VNLKQHFKRAAEKILYRWQKVCLVRALAGWHQGATDRKRFRIACRQVVLRWRCGTLMRGLSGWLDFVRRSKVNTLQLFWVVSRNSVLLSDILKSKPK